jgi:pimeloyl-ACP methyl ester carboxylesterase
VTTAADGVLLLHGQPGSARDWDGVVAGLGSGATVLALDRPGWNGHGAHSDLAGNAAAAIDALDALELGRVIVVGHSLGAAVAAWLALEYRDRVAALVLVSPAANSASIGWIDGVLAAPIVGSLASMAALSSAGLALAAPPLRRRIADGIGLDESYLGSSSRGLLTPSAWRAFVGEQRMLVRELPHLERRLPEINAPTTVVVGSADRVVSVAAARALAEQIVDSKLVVVPGAGHLLPQRQAAWLAALIGDS